MERSANVDVKYRSKRVWFIAIGVFSALIYFITVSPYHTPLRVLTLPDSGFERRSWEAGFVGALVLSALMARHVFNMLRGGGYIVKNVSHESVFKSSSVVTVNFKEKRIRRYSSFIVEVVKN
ncbi:hypothetical protein [Brevundimonas sp. SL130]|uniref:hypothetical protein n=1 Tax=Brevundimonas sp. SL130 TaxID=2995143 RepID=UPI00226CE94C|nr:hypothetical protein [Brevundimonas sp. SL130]WAC59770.1 hypothetical protein OU998_16430 [Brevundimonas sp. SL130]